MKLTYNGLVYLKKAIVYTKAFKWHIWLFYFSRRNPIAEIIAFKQDEFILIGRVDFKYVIWLFSHHKCTKVMSWRAVLSSEWAFPSVSEEKGRKVCVNKFMNGIPAHKLIHERQDFLTIDHDKQWLPFEFLPSGGVSCDVRCLKSRIIPFLPFLL